MSVELKEERKCDLCGAVIPGDFYMFQPQKVKVPDNPEDYSYTVKIPDPGIVSYNSRHLDMCLDCWEKRQTGRWEWKPKA
jgi:hypothetical protein